MQSVFSRNNTLFSSTMSVERNATEIAALKTAIKAVVNEVSTAMSKLNDNIHIVLKELERTIQQDGVRITRLERYVEETEKNDKLEAEVEKLEEELKLLELKKKRAGGTSQGTSKRKRLEFFLHL